MNIKEREKIDKYLIIARKISLNIKLMVILLVVGVLGMVSEGLEKSLRKLGIRRRENPNHTTVKISQNTKILGGF